MTAETKHTPGPWIEVPGAFIIDHEERELPTPAYERAGKRLRIRRDDENLEELLSDARHYAGNGTDAPIWLASAAKALLAAIAKAEGPTI